MYLHGLRWWRPLNCRLELCLWLFGCETSPCLQAWPTAYIGCTSALACVVPAPLNSRYVLYALCLCLSIIVRALRPDGPEMLFVTGRVYRERTVKQWRVACSSWSVQKQQTFMFCDDSGVDIAADPDSRFDYFLSVCFVSDWLRPGVVLRLR